MDTANSKTISNFNFKNSNMKTYLNKENNRRSSFYTPSDEYDFLSYSKNTNSLRRNSLRKTINEKENKDNIEIDRRKKNRRK